LPSELRISTPLAYRLVAEFGEMKMFPPPVPGLSVSTVTGSSGRPSDVVADAPVGRAAVTATATATVIRRTQVVFRMSILAL
jgi:hypothetical protein